MEKIRKVNFRGSEILESLADILGIVFIGFLLIFNDY
jgi:hypothetical protein